MRESTFVLNSLIDLYCSEPIMERIVSQGGTLHIATWERLLTRIRGLFPHLNGSVVILDDLESQFSSPAKLHSIFTLLFTGPSFSYYYQEFRNPRTRAASKLYWLVYLLSDFIPSWEKDQINRRLKFLFSHLVHNPFPTNRIVVISRAALPHLLCAKQQEVITLLGSWDHPAKFPMGYSSQGVFVWNQDLGGDWTRYQGDKEVIIGYPMKIRYGLRKMHSYMPKRNDSAKPMALYAAGTSSLSYSDVHLDELRIIHDICKATEQAGWQLLIKPKPFGRFGDFDNFADQFDHVEVGCYREASNTSDYYLDDNYNHIRFEEVNRCNLVINVDTTFALDAAVYGAPVLQLDLRNSSDYQLVARRARNHHIQEYLLGDPGLTFSLRSSQQLAQELKMYLTSLDDRPRAFSERLRRWVSPSLPYEESVAAMTDIILSE